MDFCCFGEHRFLFYYSVSWATLALLVGEEAEVEEEAVAEGLELLKEICICGMRLTADVAIDDFN